MKSRQFSRVAACILTLLASSEAAVRACSVCFGAVESPVIDATRLSVIFMLVLTYLVVGGFVAFFVRLLRREKLFVENAPQLPADERRG